MTSEVMVAKNMNSSSAKNSCHNRIPPYFHGFEPYKYGIVANCERMNEVFSVIEKVGKTDKTVLVTGESGTGKELIAKAIHNTSGRKGMIIPVNCGAIPEEILESELFGHEKGAFTGATSKKLGRFQLAHNGTIFLDEIGDMSPKLQVKLLRVLQQRVVDPVGSTRPVEVNVRVVAATNKNLEKEVEKGNFREDLYYRLNVFPIELPPLRERGNDATLIANYFMERECIELGKTKLAFSEEVSKFFSEYSWPGNIRELENTIAHIAIMVDGLLVCKEDIDFLLKRNSKNIAPSFNRNLINKIPESGINLNQLIEDIEVSYIRQALDKTNWNKKAAAELLGLNRTTLVERIRKKNIQNV